MGFELWCPDCGSHPAPCDCLQAAAPGVPFTAAQAQLARELWETREGVKGGGDINPWMGQDNETKREWLTVAIAAESKIANRPAVVAERVFSFWRSLENDLRAGRVTQSGGPPKPFPAWDEIPPHSRDMWIALAEKILSNDFLA